MARLIWKLETYEHILGVRALDGADDSGGNHELLPGLGDVEVVDTFLGASVDVALHLLGHVLGANVNLSQKVRQSVRNRFDDVRTSAAIISARSWSLLLVYKRDILSCKGCF